MMPRLAGDTLIFYTIPGDGECSTSAFLLVDPLTMYTSNAQAPC